MPALETSPATENILLTQTRIIRAPRARVYQAWTNPEIMQQWFGSPTMRCASASLDARIGGSYRIEVVNKAPGVEEARAGATVAGRYTKIVPNEMLQFTWTAVWSPNEESLVTVSLKDAPGGTEVTVLHERFASEASRDAHNAGWINALNQIETVLAG